MSSTTNPTGLRWALPVIVLVLLAACGDGAGPADNDPVLALTGGSQVDTIEARFGEPLSALVTRDGRPVAGAALRFTGSDVFLRTAGSSIDHEELIITTGASGRAEVTVIAGTFIGPAHVSVESMDGSMTGEAEFVIQPGAAAHIVVMPADTAVRVGVAIALRVTGLDRGLNPVPAPDALTFNVLTPGVVTLTGSTATGAAYGRGRVQASAMLANGPATAEALVSVVPPGRLALGGGTLANTDGSGLRSFTGGTFGSGGIANWAPDGNSLVYHENTFFAASLRLTDLAGNSSPLVATGPSFAEAFEPRYSADGSWIYFRGATHSTNDGEIWRVHADGSGLERVGEPGGHEGGDASPSPSPDGTRVVWSSGRLLPLDAEPHLIVRELLTGTETDLGVTGRFPAWSPAGTAIAYWSQTASTGYGAVWVIPPAGGAPAPVLPDGFTVYSPQVLAWSSDGEWLAMGTGGSVNGAILVRVSDRTVLPLPWSGARSPTSWHADPLP